MSPLRTNQMQVLAALEALYQQEMPHPDSSLFQAACYHFQNPGKSFRAQLALTSGIALGLNEQDNLYWAAACELLHNASLIHDDISDAAPTDVGKRVSTNSLVPIWPCVWETGWWLKPLS